MAKKQKKSQFNGYRKYNYLSADNRVDISAKVDPAIKEGLELIARDEKKNVSWVVERALAKYFGISVMLKKLKKQAKPEYQG